MNPRPLRFAAPVALATLVGAALVTVSSPPTAAAGSGTSVAVTYSSYNDADTTYRLSPQPPLTMQPLQVSATPTIVVDPSVTFQAWEGLGGSLEDTTVYQLNRLLPQNRDAALEALFDPVDGNAFSLMRLPIGCADFCRDAPNYWTYADNGGVPDPTLSSFSVQRDIDNGLIDMLHDIMAINPEVKFYSSMWSPPAWMKTNNSIVGPDTWGTCALEDSPYVHHGASTGSTVDYYPVLADYYVKYLEAYQALGVPIYALTLQNEPDIGMPYPTTCFTEEQLAEWAAVLGAALENAGLETKLWGLDLNESHAFPYTDALMTHPTAAGYIDGMGYHNYGATRLWQPEAVQGAYPGTTSHVTEISNGSARIIEYLRHGIASYSYWVTMYEFEPGPGPSFWSDQTRDPETDPDFYSPSTVSFAAGGYDDFQLNGWYYTFGQFSRFIQTGAERIASTGTVAGTVSNVAFRNPDGTIVVVAANRGTSKFNSVATNPGDKTVRIATPSGEITDTIPADTTATYVITPRSGDVVTAVTATASASAAGYTANQAVDGSVPSVWTSGADQAPGVAFTLDLGTTRTVDRLSLDHGALAGDYPEAFDVQASSDGSTWVTVASGSGTTSLTSIGFDATAARYLRVALTAPAARWFSIAEAFAHDSASGLLPQDSYTVTPFATFGTDVAANATDGTAETRWSSGVAQAPGQDLVIDLGSPRAFTTVELDTGANPGDHPRQWSIAVSPDGVTWSAPLAAGVGRRDTTVVEVPPTTARFVRITQEGVAPANFWSVAELRVFNHSTATLSRGAWVLDGSDAAASLGAAVDGDPGTRWTTGAAQSPGDYLSIDQGQIRQVSGIAIDATGSSGDQPHEFAIDLSLDGEVWREVAAGEGLAQDVRVRWPVADARFVRVRLTTPVPTQWWSVHEVNLLGAEAPVATALDRAGWTAVASSTAASLDASMALDGLLDSRWASGAAQDGTGWFQVDMGAVRTVSAIQLNAAGPVDWTDQIARTYDGDYARNYQVYVSDGGGWTLVAAGATASPAQVIHFPTQQARYINVHESGSSSYWWGIAEFYAYE